VKIEMAKRIMILNLVFLLFGLVNSVSAADDKSFATRFLGNPLLVLTALIIIDIIAFIYHKIRR
jgi:hypothetical protein